MTTLWLIFVFVFSPVSPEPMLSVVPAPSQEACETGAESIRLNPGEYLPPNFRGLAFDARCFEITPAPKHYPQRPA